MTDYNETIYDLFEWKYAELAKGNRIKASMIHKVGNRIINRRIKWITDYANNKLRRMGY